MSSRRRPRRQGILAATAAVGIGQVAAQASTVAMFSVVGRSTEAADLGRAIIGYGIAIAGAQLIDLGAQQRLLRDHALNAVSVGQLRGLAVTKPAAALALSPLAAVPLALVVRSPVAALAICVYAALRSRIVLAQALWQVQGRASRAGAVVSLERAVAAVAGIALSLTGAGATVAIAGGLLVGVAAASVPADRLLRHEYRGAPAGRGDLRAALRYGRNYASLSLAVNLLLFDTALVGAVAGPVQAAHYGIGARLISPLLTVTTALCAALVPRAARRDQSLLRPLALVTGLTMSALAMVFLAAPVLIRLTVGSQYAEATDTLRACTVVAGFISLAQPAASWLQARHDERWVGRVVPAGLVGLLIAAGVGASFAGALGAALAQVAVHVVVTAALLDRVRRVRRGPVHDRAAAEVSGS